MTSLLHAVMTATLVSSGVAEPPPSPPPLAERFDVLGIQICVGAVQDAARCDLRLLAPQRGEPTHAKASSTTASTSPPATASTSPPASASAPKPVQFSLFGRTVCLGPARGDTSCDVTLDPSPKRDTEA